MYTKIDVMLNTVDSYGNELTTVEVEDGVYDIFLKQYDEERRRMIGQLHVLGDKTVYLKVEKEGDKYLKTKAWTIHASLLDFCDKIEYRTDFAVYTISVWEAKSNGNYFAYQKNCHTTKLIVPIRYWNIYPFEERAGRLIKSLGYEWYDELKDEFQKPYMMQISRYVAQRRKVARVFPDSENIFRAFRMTQFMDVKVVIIGQDPYHGEDEATGLAFAVNANTLKLPPSLLNINKEIEQDYDEGFSLYKRVSLESWTRQGVFLLNTSLTVEKDKPGSHSGIGWQTFTRKAIEKLVSRKGKPIVFLLWGKQAQDNFLPLIGSHHVALIAPHPSPFSAHTGFFGCKHFTKTNDILKNTGQNLVSW